MRDDFTLVVYSSRSKDETMREAMADWIGKHFSAWLKANSYPDDKAVSLAIATDKPSAWLTIDDRCVRFEGDWNARELSPAALWTFKPWNWREP